MKFAIRIPSTLYKTMEADLLRPHEFAAERIGFLLTRTDDCIITAVAYVPTDERHYIKDDSVGVRFSGEAIKGAMARILGTNMGVFHVHYHDFSIESLPSFSRVDLESYREMIPGFHGANSRTAHGALVMSPDGCTTLIWPKPGAPPVYGDVSTIGFPMKFWRRNV